MGAPEPVTIRTGHVQVFTFKTGVLSRAAHDLRLSLQRFEVQVLGEAVQATFWPDSLSIDGVMKNDTCDAATLGASDKKEISENIRTKILHTDRYPEVRLAAQLTRTPGGYRLSGDLELIGKRQPVTIEAQERAGRVSGEVELQPLRWGIQPFKALMGAIKLQDRVLVRFELPVPTPAA